MGYIEIKNQKAEAGAKTVLLSVQQTEVQRKSNEVINVDDLYDAAYMRDADSLELFEIEFEFVRGSIERVGDKT